MKQCIFCNIYQNEKNKIIAENELAFAIYDSYPVNPGHILIISKRHFQNFFDAASDEISAIYELLHECKTMIDEKYQPTGYNIGVNIGYDGGQTVMHLHVHLIPRYKGDIENPKGGIRVIKPQLVHYEG